MSRIALVALTILALGQPSFAESIALSVHIGKIEGPGFQKNDVAVVLGAESVVGPSILEFSAMVIGNPLARSPEEQTSYRSVSMVPRLIIGPHVCRISVGAGGGIVERTSTTVSDPGYHEKHKQRGILFLGALELRISPKKNTCISVRMTQLRTRFPGERLLPIGDWKPAMLYTIGWVAEFG